MVREESVAAVFQRSAFLTSNLDTWRLTLQALAMIGPLALS